MDVPTTVSCGAPRTRYYGDDGSRNFPARFGSQHPGAPPFFTGDIRPAGHLIPGHASQNLNLAGKWTTSINP